MHTRLFNNVPDTGTRHLFDFPTYVKAIVYANHAVKISRLTTSVYHVKSARLSTIASKSSWRIAVMPDAVLSSHDN